MADYATPDQISNFYHGGMEQLDRLMLGEEAAKTAMMVGMVAGLDTVFYGPPSGCKTELAANAFRLISDIDPINVVTIPPLEDLAPQQLVGGIVNTLRTRTGTDGIPEEETVGTVIKAMITPETQVLFANEINRLNPDVLKAVLDTFESGRVDTSDGTTYLRNLVFNVATMNPSERREGTHNIPSAWRSRFSIGAELGRDQVTNSRIFQEATKGKHGFKAVKGEEIKPVTDLATIQTMREQATETMVIPDSLQEHAWQRLAKIHDNLAQQGGFDEAPARFAYRTVAAAQTRALLRSNEGNRVTEEDLVSAARYAVLARVGMQGANRSNQTVSDLANQIVEG